MTIHRRRLLLTLALAGASLSASPGHAQDAAWPSRPITIVVTYPAGGGTDVIARLIAPKMSEALGQPVVIDNRAGAAGRIGAASVAKSAPDGYTVMIDTSGIVVNPILDAKLSYSSNSFVPIGLVNAFPLVLVSNPAFPAKTVAELVQQAKAAPNKLSYASPGAGSLQHIALEQFLQLSGAQIVHVPYKGGPPAIADVMAGHVPLFVANITSTMAIIRSAKLRPLAVMSAKRSPALPDVPTLAEAGVPNSELYEWCGMFAPVGTNAAVVAKLSAALKGALAAPDVRAKITELGAEIFPANEDVDKFMTSQAQRLGAVIQKANIRID
jgi:tripartite-type tricarboxylate transporter receptor subunit TctC